MSSFCRVRGNKYQLFQLTFRDLTPHGQYFAFTFFFDADRWFFFCPCLNASPDGSDGGGAAPVSLRSSSGPGHQLPTGDPRSLCLLRHFGTPQCQRGKHHSNHIKASMEMHRAGCKMSENLNTRTQEQLSAVHPELIFQVLIFHTWLSRLTEFTTLGILISRD